MAVEEIVVMGGAPAGKRHLPEAEATSLIGKAPPQVHLPGPPAVTAQADPFQHLRTYFIAITAYAYATVHYDL